MNPCLNDLGYYSITNQNILCRETEGFTDLVPGKGGRYHSEGQRGIGVLLNYNSPKT